MADEWIAPSITGALALATGVTAAIIAGRNARRGVQEQRAPDVTEAWAEADRARARSRLWEDLYYLIRGGFKGYARRMQDRHGDAAALNDEERAALEAPTPDTKKESS